MEGHWGRRELGEFGIRRRKSYLVKGEPGKERGEQVSERREEAKPWRSV